MFEREVSASDLYFMLAESDVLLAMLNQTRETCADAITNPTDANKSAVSTLLPLYHSDAFLNKPVRRSIEYRNMIADLQAKLQQSERLRLLAAYGDYIAKFLADIRRRSKGPENGYLQGFTHPQLILAQSVYWTEVNDALTKEEEDDTLKDMTIKSLISVAQVFNLSYVHLRQLIRLYSDRNKLVHNDIRQLIAERKWNDLGRTLESDSFELQTSLVETLTEFERDAIQFVIDQMKDQYFDSIEPGEGGIKINEATYQADIDFAVKEVWDGLVESGATPELAHLEALRLGWKRDWTKQDINKLETKFKARIEAAEQEAVKRKSERALEGKPIDTLPP